MLITETCQTCKGAKVLEYEEEMGFDGEWRRRKGGADPIWPLLVKERPDIARYTEDACEVCHGRGEYELEFIRGAMIF
jgi:hypothetical protein